MNDNQSIVSGRRGSFEGQAGWNHRAGSRWAVFYVSHPTRDEWRKGSWVKIWQGHSPANSGSSSGSQRHKWPLPAMWLLWARQCREQWLGSGWELQPRGSRELWMRSTEGLALPWLGSFRPVVPPLCTWFLYFIYPLPGLLEELKGRMDRRMLWKYML